jgi:hypothetical protein
LNLQWRDRARPGNPQKASFSQSRCNPLAAQEPHVPQKHDMNGQKTVASAGKSGIFVPEAAQEPARKPLIMDAGNANRSIRC